MDLFIDLNLVRSQKVVLTPKIKQLLEILNMNSQELFEYVEEQLEVNPALEVVEIDDNPSGNSQDTLYSKDSDLDLFDEFCMYDELEYYPPYDYLNLISLKDYLLFQLNTSDIEEKYIDIAEYLIGSIDDNGYLAIELSEVASYFNVNVMDISKILKKIQTFEPPGVGARNLRECLLIQINRMKQPVDDVMRIVESHLEELSEEKFDIISRISGVPVKRIEEISEMVKKLEPKPGREYYKKLDFKYIIPDIIVRKGRKRYDASVNEDSVPQLRISKYYETLLSTDVGKDVKKFITIRIDNAIWLIKCLEQRKFILGKAAETIINTQTKFFDKGRKYIKPLSIEKISENLKLHESMIKDIFEGKYLQCSWGIFELKSFISF